MPSTYPGGTGLNNHVSLLAHPIQKRMLFFTEYHFNEQGLAKMIAAFNRAFNQNGMEAQLDWVGACQAFRIICLTTKAAEISSRFRTYLANFIKKQLPRLEREPGDEEDEEDEDECVEDIETFFDPEERLESRYIQRLEVWKKEVQQVQTSALNHSVSLIVTTTPTLSMEIDRLKFKKSWLCEKDGVFLDDMLSENTLLELTQLTSCHFLKSYAEDRVIVGGNFQQDVDLAFMKLDNIRVNFSIRGCFTNHLLYTESEENVRFVLKFIRHINKQLFKTTILDNLDVHINLGVCDYRTLVDAVRIRCAPYHQKKALFIPISDKNLTKPIEFHEPGLKGWTGYVYSARRAGDVRPTISQFPNGLPSNAPPIVELLKNGSNLPTGNERKIKQNAKIVLWRNNLPLAIQSLASRIGNHSQVDAHLQTSDPITSGSKFSSPFLPETRWDTHQDWKDPDCVRFEGGGPQISKGLKANLAAFNSDLPPTKPTPSQVSKPVTRQPSAAQTKAAFCGNSQRPPAIAQLNLLESNDDQLPPHLRSGKLMNILQASTPLFSKVLQAPIGTTINSGPVKDARNNPQAILGDYASPVIQRSLLDDEILEPLSLFSEVLQPNNIIQERIQSFEEGSTRMFEGTMRQQAGKLSKKPNTFAGRLEVPEWPVPLPKKPLRDEMIGSHTVDPLPELATDINQIFTDMVKPLNGFQGVLQIQVDFGRIILHKFNPKQISDKDNNIIIVHDAASIRNMVLKPTTFGPTSNFTKVVTTKAGEMPSMLEMKSRSSALLWDQRVTSWDVIYEFTFFDKFTNTRFIVEIDAESFVTQVKIKQDLGVIFIHGTQRYHDMQISVAGYAIEEARKKYGQVAKMLETSLWIPCQKTEPELQWVFNRELLNQFELEDLTVRRTSRFNALDKNSHTVLVISDLYSLDVAGAWSEGEKHEICVFYGTPGPTNRKPCEKLNAWQEASITSTQINDLVAANKTLELGDRAGWTPVDMSGAALDMCSPAFEMLKQMDSFGWEDENGVPITSDFQVNTSHHTSAPKYVKQIW